MNTVDIFTLSDDELMNRVEVLVFRARCAAADVVEHLAEIDRRGLCPKREYGSLFEYCVNRLRMSEGSAYRHIRAARAFRAFPPVLNLLRDGRLPLESLALLHAHVNDDDIAILVTKAAGLRTRQLEALLAERCPQDQRREVVRFVGSAPSAKAAPEGAAPEALPFDAVVDVVGPMFAGAVPPPPPAPAVIAPPAPPAPRLVRFAFTADEEFYLLLERVRALMRHKYPDGRLDGVLRDALRALLERKDPVIRWETRRRRREKTAPAQ